MKTIKRIVIIREDELSKLLSKTIKNKLYDRVDIEPMTYKGISQENMLSALRNEPVPTYRPLPNLYEEMLWREPALYDRRYLNWQLTMDYPNGQIYVQSSIKHAKQPLFRVTFERDYDYPSI